MYILALSFLFKGERRVAGQTVSQDIMLGASQVDRIGSGSFVCILRGV